MKSGYIQSSCPVHLTKTFREIDEVLNGAFWGIPLSDLERCYQQRHNKSLDYKSLGVANIQELFLEADALFKVLLLRKPESPEIYVMSVTLAVAKQKRYLKMIVKELLHQYGGEIPFTSFQGFYEDKYKVEWNPLEYGFTHLDQICHVLKDKDIEMVESGSLGEKVIKAVNRDPFDDYDSTDFADESSGQAAYSLRKRKRNTYKSRVFGEIEEILVGSFQGIAMSDLSYIEDRYKFWHGKPLDYMSFGVRNIQDLFFKLGKQKKVLLLKEAESKETYVMSVSLAEEKQKGCLKFNVEKLLDKYGGEIAFTSFGDFYKDTLKGEWRSLDFGLRDLDELCHVLKDIVTVEVNSSGKKVMKAIIRDFSVVTREIEEILGRCPLGIAMSDSYLIEGIYQLQHGKPLDYESFGVENIEELVVKLANKKEVLLKRTESGIFVMSVRLAGLQNKGKLKFNVEELLRLYDGEIAFSSFVDCYECSFQVNWNPLLYGLTDLDGLCDILRDIVMVGVNSSGEKVIMAVNKDSRGQVAYNLRKREDK